MKTKKTTPKASKKNYVIVGNGNYGLYYGHIKTTDEKAIKDKAVRIFDCRHVARWYGKGGGISSLAAFGPCGPSVGQCRIGHPCPSSLVMDVKAIHGCSDEAVKAFAAVAPNE
jgi:hypothetical protein